MRKISVVAAVALAAIIAIPSASFAASKTKDSSGDVTKCQGGGCTAVNPDRDPNTSIRSRQLYRSAHRKHKIQPKN
jgi:hypothetical protein